MQKHGERERASERKKYFQNLGTKVCVILFLKSLLMRASVRPSVLLGCCKFVLACMRCQSPPLEETQGILVMQSSTATLLILLRPPKVCYLLFAKARKSPLQNKNPRIVSAWEKQKRITPTHNLSFHFLPFPPPQKKNPKKLPECTCQTWKRQIGTHYTILHTAGRSRRGGKENPHLPTLPKKREKKTKKQNKTMMLWTPRQTTSETQANLFQWRPMSVALSTKMQALELATYITYNNKWSSPTSWQRK
jgi:hypothetical protein